MKQRLLQILVELLFVLPTGLLAQSGTPFIELSTHLSSTIIHLKLSATSAAETVLLQRGSWQQSLTLGATAEALSIEGEGDTIRIEGAIASLSCSEGGISSVNASSEHPLKKLVLNKNQIHYFDATNFPNLEALGLSDCELEEINLTGGVQLNNINLNNNKLRGLDLSSCRKLQRLQFAGNGLDACALDDIYQTLPMLPTPSPKANLINEKQGGSNMAARSNTSIAEALNWKVQMPGDGSGCTDEDRLPHIKIRTDKRSQQTFYLRLEGDGEVNFDIDWGDGQKIPYHKEQEPNGQLLIIEGSPLAEQVVFWGSFTRFEATDAEITSIDLSKAPSLTYLGLRHNQLTSIDLSTCPKLESLYLRDNQLRELDLSACPLLEELYIRDNLIRDIDFSTIPLLKELAISRNPLDRLDLSHTPELTKLYASGLKLRTLDLRHSPNLYQLEVGYNELEQLDISPCPEIGVINIEHNRFSACALNDLYRQLPKPQRRIDWTNLVLGEEQNEVKTSFTDIAVAKGWRPDVIGDGSGCPISSPYIILEGGKSFSETMNIRMTVSGPYELLGADKEEESSYRLYASKVMIIGPIRELAVPDNDLQKVSLSQADSLRRLDVSHNALTSLDLSEARLINTVSLHDNQIDSVSMGALIASLPLRVESDHARLLALDTKQATERNQIKLVHTSAAESKGWKIYDYQGGINEDEGVPYVDSTTDLIQSSPQTALRLYPNPVIDRLYIEAISDCPIALYSPQGVLLINSQCDSTGRLTLDLSQLPSGSYFLQIGSTLAQIIVVH